MTTILPKSDSYSGIEHLVGVQAVVGVTACSAPSRHLLVIYYLICWILMTVHSTLSHQLRRLFAKLAAELSNHRPRREVLGLRLL